MNTLHISKIAKELGIAEKQVLAAADLLSEGATVLILKRALLPPRRRLQEPVILSLNRSTKTKMLVLRSGTSFSQKASSEQR